MNSSVSFPHMAPIKQAAAVSGLAVYRIRELCRAGKVAHVQCGRRILVNLDKLAEYMATGDAPETVPPEQGGIRRICI